MLIYQRVIRGTPRFENLHMCTHVYTTLSHVKITTG